MNVLHVGVAQEHCFPLFAECVSACDEPYCLEVDEQFDKRCDRRILQWIARGDIHMLNLGRKTMDDGWQQTLVGHDDGCASPVLDTLLVFQPCTDKSGLNVFRHGTQISDVFGLIEIMIYILFRSIEFVGELLQVLPDIGSGLMVYTVMFTHVIIIEVPIEVCLSQRFKSFTELLFHGLHHIETYENIVVVSEVYLLLLNDFSVKGTFVGKSLSI